MAKKTALITGITGQDGAYLAKFLLEKNYNVYGLYRRTSSPNMWRLLSLGVCNKITLLPGDITDMASITNAIIESRPDEIYNLAAQSFVGTSFEQPLATAAVDGCGVLMLVEAVKQINPKIRIYHASTSELYGNCMEIHSKEAQGLHEKDVLWPVSPYAAAKLYSFHIIRIYREAYNMFAVNGILFNHESPLRGLEFVTRKISNSVARIKLGLQEKIELGNLSAKRDWGYAPEYVEAMWLMLQQDTPDDFTIATGQMHSVMDFAECACKYAGINPEKVIVEAKKYKRPLELNCLMGDPVKARKILKWSHRLTFKQLCETMVKADMDRWQDHLDGKIFPWDANNDPRVY